MTTATSFGIFLAIFLSAGILWAIYTIEERILRQQTKKRHPSNSRRGDS